MLIYSDATTLILSVRQHPARVGDEAEQVRDERQQGRGRAGPDHQVRLPVTAPSRVLGALQVMGIVRVRRSLRYPGGPRGVLTRGEGLSHAARARRGW